MAAVTGTRRAHATCLAGGSDTVTVTGLGGLTTVVLEILSRNGAATLWISPNGTPPVPADPSADLAPGVVGASTCVEVPVVNGEAVVSVAVAAGLSAVDYTVRPNPRIVQGG